MKCNSIHIQLISYLEGELDNDLRNVVEAHLKACSQCSGLFIRLKKAFELVDEEKKIQHDPYMFTRIMARLEDRKPVIPKGKFQAVFQTLAFIAIIAAGIYSGILAGKNFTGESTISSDYQNEVYFLDELQHENMISVLLSD